MICGKPAKFREPKHMVNAPQVIASYKALFGFGFYLASDDHRYVRYELMWLFYLLLAYWITHVWLTAERGEIRNDPVSFVLSGRLGRIVSVLMAVTVLAAA